MNIIYLMKPNENKYSMKPDENKYSMKSVK